MSVQNPLKAARLKARLTQAELAERAGVSDATVSYCERGTRPSPRVQRALAAALGVDPEQLWSTSEPRR